MKDISLQFRVQNVFRDLMKDISSQLGVENVFHRPNERHFIAVSGSTYLSLKIKTAATVTIAQWLLFFYNGNNATDSFVSKPSTMLYHACGLFGSTV
jgi:hypothetical protein